LSEASAQPASSVIVIEPTGDESITTIRAALARILASEPRDLNWGIRDGHILISKGELPPRPRSG
jgi:hypothetical protein